MSLVFRVVTILSAVFATASAFGHGTPIVVTLNENKLQVNGGATGNTDGYAGQINVQSGSFGDPEDYNDFANFGESIYWTVPGLEINGLAEGSGLYLQTIARPVSNGSPNESRVLWYWNPTSPLNNKVELAPADSRLQIRRSASLNTLITPTTFSAPPPLRFANPDLADMGFHNHGLLWYLLPYPLPADGAYAFFARFTSDLYAPSDPFLLVINNGGLSNTQMQNAAADINRSAFLPGDFNHDNRVDGADYVLWRDNAGTAEDYQLWRGAFGATFSGPGSGASAIESAAVPEPSVLMLILAAFTLAGATRTRRYR